MHRLSTRMFFVFIFLTILKDWIILSTGQTTFLKMCPISLVSYQLFSISFPINYFLFLSSLSIIPPDPPPPIPYLTALFPISLSSLFISCLSFYQWLTDSLSFFNNYFLSLFPYQTVFWPSSRYTNKAVSLLKQNRLISPISFLSFQLILSLFCKSARSSYVKNV
jgi:hypothetical protein